MVPKGLLRCRDIGHWPNLSRDLELPAVRIFRNIYRILILAGCGLCPHLAWKPVWLAVNHDTLKVGRYRYATGPLQ